MNENLKIYTGMAASTDRNIVSTVATLGADTHINVTVCDGRPEDMIDEITGNAVRMVTNSTCWTSHGSGKGEMARAETTTALTPAQALSLARDLIAQAATILEAK